MKTHPTSFRVYDGTIERLARLRGETNIADFLVALMDRFEGITTPQERANEKAARALDTAEDALRLAMEALAKVKAIEDELRGVTPDVTLPV